MPPSFSQSQPVFRAAVLRSFLFLRDLTSAIHSFLALAVWPAVARRDGEPLLRPAVSLAAAAGLLGLVSWFGVELAADSGRVGLSERVAAGAQALWPLAVAWGTVAAGAVARRRRWVRG
jgi:hypothetical protein